MSLSGSPSPTSCAAFRFDSFEQEVGGISYKGGDGGLSPPSVSSPTPGTAFYKGGGGGGVGDRERLVLEVTKLYRERNRLARIHRKAELRVLTSLRRRRQSRDGVTDEVDEDEEDSAEMGQVDWVSQATQARESLVEADQSAQAQELHYKLLLEEARGNTATTAKQVSASMEKLTEHQRQLVKRSFSSLPPERDRQTVVENLLSRQKQAHEQVKQARTSYYSLLLRKQQEEKELKENLERFDDQENSISAHQASLKQMAEKFKKLCQQKNDFEESITKVKETLNSLSKQLTEERNKLKDLSKMQAKTQLLVRSLKPSSRLLLDPVLARDLEEKLAVKHKLEDEISRLKQVCEREVRD
ncbi:myosin-10-like isoform X2 [Portunus trituberculatus]|uniref:myosin-10-like isoform X2 n=1 Tax=Portunus trituberculatus TaxID=210409 RepID=UPI001E1CB917|nr:myosin-10-like isoform X2 [Portunus trituberculatus]